MKFVLITGILLLSVFAFSFLSFTNANFLFAPENETVYVTTTQNYLTSPFLVNREMAPVEFRELELLEVDG
jgi:hypothetical protein